MYAVSLANVRTAMPGWKAGDVPLWWAIAMSLSTVALTYLIMAVLMTPRAPVS